MGRSRNHAMHQHPGGYSLSLYVTVVTSNVKVFKDSTNCGTCRFYCCLLFKVRQALTFSLAQIMQIIIVDFWCLNTQFFVNTFGRLLSLFLTSWKGWPFIAFLWGIMDFIFLYGESQFASHWLYWQRIFYIFTELNPSYVYEAIIHFGQDASHYSVFVPRGEITYSLWYTRILSVAVSVGLTVGVKRLWLGFYLGRKTYGKLLSLCVLM